MFTQCQACTRHILRLFAFTVLCVLGLSPSVQAAAGTVEARTFLDFHDRAPFTPPPPGQQWNHYTLSNASDGLQIELKDELGNPTGIQFSWQKLPGWSTGMQNVSIWSSLTPNDIQLNAFDHNLTAQTSGEYIELTGLVPGRAYKFWLLTWTYPADFRTPKPFEVTGGGGWTQLTTPPDTRLAINGQVGDTARTFDSYAIQFDAAGDGRLELRTSTGQFTGVFGFVIEPVPEPTTGLLLLSLSAAALLRRRGDSAQSLV